MGLFSRKKATGFMNEIRCDEPSYLVWKWHPAGLALGETSRENAIRWGSPLRVKEGEVAVFVYKQPKGHMLDFIEGPFDKIIETKNLPVLASIVGLAYAGGTPFQAEIYFINLARVIQVKFAVPFFDVYDPRFMDFGVPVAVRGTVSFSITDYREFIKLHRLNDFTLNDFEKEIRDALTRYTKDVVTNAPAENNIPVIQLESKLSIVNDKIEYIAGERLKENFGVTVSGIDISAIELDKSSDGYKQLMEVTQKVSARTIEAQTTATIRDIHAKQRIEAKNYEETLRIQREEGQYAQHKQTQSSNFAAFQVEAQTEVGVAGANALGKMGSNGAGKIQMGGNSGFDPAAMMASMTVGGAVGKNIAGVMEGVMTGTKQPTAGSVPPPIPMTTYHVAVNGQATGPYDIPMLTQMVSAGTFKKTDLVWKQGMETWVTAGSVEELHPLFINEIPPIPSTK